MEHKSKDSSPVEHKSKESSPIEHKSKELSPMEHKKKTLQKTGKPASDSHSDSDSDLSNEGWTLSRVCSQTTQNTFAR